MIVFKFLYLCFNPQYDNNIFRIFKCNALIQVNEKFRFDHSLLRIFTQGNADEMIACYDDNIVFTDPAFGMLKGEDAKNMWRMLIHRSKGNLKINFEDVTADEKTGSANWTAEYIFNQTGKK